jgi:hypothetical protein
MTEFLAGHSAIAGRLAARGQPLAPLPFPGAIWSRGTGENVWRPRGFASIAGRRISADIQADFGIEAPATTLLAEFAASIRQLLPALRAPLADTLWRGPHRTIRTLRGKAWKP